MKSLIVILMIPVLIGSYNPNHQRCRRGKYAIKTNTCLPSFSSEELKVINDVQEIGSGVRCITQVIPKCRKVKKVVNKKICYNTYIESSEYSKVETHEISYTNEKKDLLSIDCWEERYKTVGHHHIGHWFCDSQCKNNHFKVPSQSRPIVKDVTCNGVTSKKVCIPYKIELEENVCKEEKVKKCITINTLVHRNATYHHSNYELTKPSVHNNIENKLTPPITNI
ncbi:unnamed protein product [Lepeophtheirus salmonis]|uniref:(salmon louse) hypothetical protein n=1 Tax=Lepeophtheirus salmonis TaxID=72036 RepID=A0A7R8D339_LEPSM|nr:unnamed protein product [Lepeophtheirus salmonis]CAF3012545.1 unnamed protein product [Lepeophtheirus salmonis]